MNLGKIRVFPVTGINLNMTWLAVTIVWDNTELLRRYVLKFCPKVCPVTWISIGVIALILFLVLFSSFDNSVLLATPQTKAQNQAELFARSQKLLEQDTQLLFKKASGRLNTILDPIFVSYHRRIPDFATWAFQWRTSYNMLRRGVITAITLPLTDNPGLHNFGQAWDELIAEKFYELVLKPEGGEYSLREARNQWELEVYSDLKLTMTNAVFTAALLHGEDLALWSWQPTMVQDISNKDAAALAEAIGAVTNPIKIHAVRPILTRLTLRPPVAATMTLIGEGFSGYGDFGLFGSLTVFTATIAGFLSLDYLISRIDAAVSQQYLEVEIHQAVDAEYDRIRQSWLNNMEPQINAQMLSTSNMLKRIFWQNP
ncbi:hypothetical protein TI04_07370 [Achromatium sp. WMS2]|nr:hypothetical protein TI04_07370 [Achromatium sp. WMS2]